MRKTFAAPKLVEEASLAKITLNGHCISSACV